MHIQCLWPSLCNDKSSRIGLGLIFSPNCNDLGVLGFDKEELLMQSLRMILKNVSSSSIVSRDLSISKLFVLSLSTSSFVS